MIKKISYMLVAFALLPQIAAAQTKAETKLYQKTISKPSVASYDKFLKKYPSSVYAAEITAKKDTLLNISPYTLADAERIVADQLQPGLLVKAMAWRSEGTDRISGVGYDGKMHRVMSLEKDDAGWNIASDYTIENDDIKADSKIEFVDSSCVLKFAGVEYLRFNLLTGYAGGDSLSYEAVLFCPKDDLKSCSLSFLGRRLAGGEGYSMEGIIDDGLKDNMNTAPMVYLKSELQNNKYLHELPMETILTDEAIRWWIQKNPSALSSATSISFGQIPEESSLAQTFGKVKKETCAKYRAAMFDIRDYTVVVAQDRTSGKYILAWAEPECRDHKNGRLLNNIYFEDGSSLVLFYYHGKKTFKYRLNLANKSLKR